MDTHLSCLFEIHNENRSVWHFVSGFYIMNPYNDSIHESFPKDAWKAENSMPTMLEIEQKFDRMKKRYIE